MLKEIIALITVAKHVGCDCWDDKEALELLRIIAAAEEAIKPVKVKEVNRTYYCINCEEALNNKWNVCPDCGKPIDWG